MARNIEILWGGCKPLQTKYSGKGVRLYKLRPLFFGLPEERRSDGLVVGGDFYG